MNININLEFPTAESIRKHLGTAHGTGLLALAIMDEANRNLQIEISNLTQSELKDICTQLFSIYARIKPYFRKLEINGKEEKKYEQIEFGISYDVPDIYNKFPVCLDVEIHDYAYIWKFYRKLEQTPRILKIMAIEPLVLELS
jgi:hypothetical protein